MAGTITGPIKPARGLQASLDAMASGGTLVQGAIYFTTDTRRFCLATSVNAYVALVRLDEIGPQIKVVTQTEYDALSTTDKNNPAVTYMIKE